MNRIDRLTKELENKGIENVLSKETIQEITKIRTELQESTSFQQMVGATFNTIIKDGTPDIEGVIIPNGVQYFILGYYTRMDVEKEEIDLPCPECERREQREAKEKEEEVKDHPQMILDLKVKEEMQEE